MTPSQTSRPFVLLLALVALVALGAATVNAGASSAPAPGGEASAIFPPLSLTGASASDRASETHSVTGVGFTPGGRVEIAIYDESGTELLESRWVTGTATVYGRDVTAEVNDPMVGFTRAGVISAPFETACGTTTKARAYDQQTARWSDWLELAPRC